MVDKNEEQIRRAMEDGLFENLPGKGKPLNLDENPFEDPEWRMAHHILKEGGFSPPWIEARNEIESELASARDLLGRKWAWRKSALARGLDWRLVEREWNTAQDTFRQKIDAINKLIRDYNLQTPLLQLQILQLKADQELEKILGR